MNNFLLIVISILLSIGLGLVILPILKRKKIGQNIREVGPKSHLKKAGTPTMGGIIFIIAALILSLIFLPLDRLEVWIVILSTIGFGAIGFIDDFRKLILKQSEGLSPRGKIILQFGLALLISVLAYINDKDSITSFVIPFTDTSISLGILGIPIMIFIIVGTTNATNLTDGLDGLLATVSLPVFITLAIIGKGTDNEIFSYIMLGSLLGFLIFNSNPAAVFMGDTGSMAIGGAIVAMAINLRIPLYLIIFGGIYVLETLSVIIQVTSYRHRNKKRVFLMTPIHHHFELKGYKEQKIVVAFAVVSVIFCMITLAALV
ncbi:MAG: phospho-N-acetylmuramoyl-pentapeptide-transferase [Anaerococcus sp.]|uniref:phospho-N-acetylmuramoyl-pentapeptide- transferase n=1 Tax=Anaerococcus sp. TaxID=1872515 RepID=UPI002627AADB|nr:phospho-N-acetylmuramoyl-pentapeptide-transferase [Anaerococcus sp.]MCI5971623.1 phospho-N-acetylmuramoyl-pentapeptide-transferase [Anaerococcus sp.]MDD6918411.1 phospho-N-acetylmuramoyl-pentapeptide-transferase [Peptoniphilaceae bacterium]MDY2928185.1 phospho-N-acetylmuramoyl-pentapeptide-transferase [Anaerococcus sp.]